MELVKNEEQPMETVSTYTRQQAIDDHVLIEIMAPMYNGNETLQMLLGGNHSIAMTDSLLSTLLNLCDDKNGIEFHIQNMGRKMVSEVHKMRDEKLPCGNTLIFSFVAGNETKMQTLELKSVTHLEPNFKNLERAKCMTFMLATED